MCLIGVAFNAHPEFPLIVVANRDEFHVRPTAPMQWRSGLLGGRDLQAGGTWMGLDQNGRLAAVTNYRQWPADLGERSRGRIPLGFLGEPLSPGDYAMTLANDADRFAGFNALFGSRRELWWYSNRGGACGPLTAGVHGLSNHLLDTPWPKVDRLTRGLGSAVASDQVESEQLLRLMRDQSCAADHQLPDTGVGLETERMLSAMFIVNPAYGTRCSTIIRLRASGGDVLEVNYAADGRELNRSTFALN